MKHLKWLILMLFCVTLVSCNSAFAEQIQWTIDDNNVLKIYGSGDMKDYDPDVYHAPWQGWGYTSVIIDSGITRVGEFAFAGCNTVTDVTISDSVATIGRFAFDSCENLSNIRIPDSVTTIENGAFHNCYSLERINIPDSVISIGCDVFAWCTSLSHIVIPDSVISLGYGAFSKCTSLTNITIPDSIVSIEGWLFSECSSLISVTMPDSITSIGENAFMGCYNLTDLIIPKGVTIIGEWAFEGCTSLTSLTIPDSVSSIGEAAFMDTGLTSVIIPEGVISIESQAFWNSDLESITLPASILSIGNLAFASTNISDVIIPENVVNIGEQAFRWCNKLMNLTIPASVLTIGQQAFASCDSLVNVGFMYNDETIDISYAADVFDDHIPTIYCHMFSMVDSWATTNGIPVKYYEAINLEDIRTVSLSSVLCLECGNSNKVIASVFPNDDALITWMSSNPAIVSVVDGLVTALDVGTAIITASVGSASASVTITTFMPATGFDLNMTEAWVLAKNPLQLAVTSYEPANASAEITWTSSDATRATVDENGLVTTILPGDVTITATTERGVQRKCIVHMFYPITTVAFEKAEVDAPLGFPVQLTANVTARTQTCVNHLITFTSSDEDVATVDSETGIVTCVGFGTATITATANSNASLIAVCTVTVREPHILTLPTALATIDAEAFANLPNVDAIRIPEKVSTIDADAFSGSSIYIIAPSGSYAEAWATEHGIPFIAE